MKNIISFFIIILLTACTHISTLNYEVQSLSGNTFTQEDLNKIDRFLVKNQNKEKASSGNSYYLWSFRKQGYGPTDVMTIENNKKVISINVTRFSSALGFSKKWIEQFEKGTKYIIEKATGKKVALVEIVKK